MSQYDLYITVPTMWFLEFLWIYTFDSQRFIIKEFSKHKFIDCRCKDWTHVCSALALEVFDMWPKIHFQSNKTLSLLFRHHLLRPGGHCDQPWRSVRRRWDSGGGRRPLLRPLCAQGVGSPHRVCQVQGDPYSRWVDEIVFFIAPH